MTVLRRIGIAALLAAGLALPVAGAGAAAPTGFRSTGTLVVQATIGGSPLNVGGNIALFARGTMYRLDLLSLGFPGADPTASSVAGALLAPGGATLLYNGLTGAVSAYSTGNHAYYEDAARSARAAPSPPPDGVTAGPLATLAGVARQLHDAQRAAILLTGHSSVNGHPTDDLDVSLQRHRPGKPPEDYHAQISLATDLDGFPVRIAASSIAPTPQDFGGSLRLDLTVVARDSPDVTIFAIPPGLTRVDSLGAVLQAKAGLSVSALPASADRDLRSRASWQSANRAPANQRNTSSTNADSKAE